LQNSLAHRFRFGEWRVDPSTNLVSDGTTETQLEPRAMDVLVFLCRQNGTIVSADQLLDACWGQSDVGDNPVHKVITQIRRALGDSSSAPRYIETIRKRGYRTVAEVVAEDAVAGGSWLAESPFRGLEAFEEKHASIFFGRQQNVALLQQNVLNQVAAGCAMVLVLGPSGSGKTSLVRAGLLPQLSPENTPAGSPIGITCSLYMDCADLVGADPFTVLASHLLDAETERGPVFDMESAQSLGRRLASDTASVVAQLQQLGPCVRLAMVVDRFEAMLRPDGGDQAFAHQMVDLLEQLARSGGLLVILGCRNDFYPELADYPALQELKLRGGHFDLNPPNGSEIAQIIRQPARAANLMFEVDAQTGVHLDEVLYDAAKVGADTLPLLQYCLLELYRQRDASGTLTFAVFRSLGGIEGAIGERAEQVVTALAPAQLAALPRVLFELVNMSEENAAVTSKRAPWTALRSDDERMLVQAMVDARLFVSDLAGQTPIFGIAHEALLRRWPRAIAWIEQHRNDVQLRVRIRHQALRWAEASHARDLLLPAGILTNQAKHLLSIEAISLDQDEVDYIRASIRRANLNRRVRIALGVAIASLSLLAAGLGVLARSAQIVAEQRRSEAEGVMGYMLDEFVDKLRPIGKLELLDNVSTRALKYLNVIAKEESSQADLRQRARALQVISEVKRSRGDSAAAIEALVVAQTILDHQVARAPNDKALIADLAKNAFYQGQLHLDKSEWLPAKAALTRYRELNERAVALDPNNIDAQANLAAAHNNLGRVAIQLQELDEAANEYSTAVSLGSQVFERSNHDPVKGNSLANMLLGFGNATDRRGRLLESQRTVSKATELLRTLLLAAPEDAKLQTRLASALRNKAVLNTALGQDHEALAALEEAARLLGRLSDLDPTNQPNRQQLLYVRLNMVDLKSYAQTTTALLAELKEIQESANQLRNFDSDEFRIFLGLLPYWEANLLTRMGRLAEAENDVVKAIGLLEGLKAKPGIDKQILYRTSVASAYLGLGRLQQLKRNVVAEQQACSVAFNTLSDKVSNSTDFRLLDPWIRANVCLGKADAVTRDRDILKSMAYRKTAFLQYLPPHLQKEYQ
jgi:DNA-binding winged helix-turn-helix (wHTH) protein/tetratricopeptide (TPR) repeat protein